MSAFSNALVGVLLAAFNRTIVHGSGTLNNAFPSALQQAFPRASSPAIASFSLENYSEQVEVLLLKAQSSIDDSVQIVRQDEDGDVELDRIVVAHSPREVEVADPIGQGAIVIRIPITVTIKLISRDAERMDILVKAINDAQDQPSSAALTLAAMAFPNGAFIRMTDSGASRSSGNIREESRTLDFVITL